MDWWPGVNLSTGLVTLALGMLIWSSSIDTIWPKCGRGRYVYVTALPLLFIVSTTFTAVAIMVSGQFWPTFYRGWKNGNLADELKGGLCCVGIVFLIFCFVVILGSLIAKCVSFLPKTKEPIRNQ